MHSISIVVPAYNEEARLPATLESICSYLDRGGWQGREILVIDDGSTDGTCRVAEEVSRTRSGIRLLKNPGNRGKGFAVRHGVLQAQGDWILFTDADLSAPIEEIEKLWAACASRNARVAIGSRALDRSLIAVRQSFIRETSGRFFNLLVRLATGLPFRDTQCGFKLFEREAARDIFRRQRLERFGFDAEVLFIARLLGYACVEVPVRWSHSAGTKVSMLRDSASMFFDLLRVRWNQLLGRYRSAAPPAG